VRGCTRALGVRWRRAGADGGLLCAAAAAAPLLIAHPPPPLSSFLCALLTGRPPGCSVAVGEGSADGESRDEWANGTGLLAAWRSLGCCRSSPAALLRRRLRPAPVTVDSAAQSACDAPRRRHQRGQSHRGSTVWLTSRFPSAPALPDVPADRGCLIVVASAQVLQSDGLVDTDKIGSGNFFCTINQTQTAPNRSATGLATIRRRGAV